MIWMLDTNILIYLMKHKPRPLVDRISSAGDGDEVKMSFVTYAELLKGAEGSVRKEKVLTTLSELTRTIPVDYSVESDMCRSYGYHAMRLKEAGTPIGGNDLWIASHALSIDAVLVTNNLSEFSRIDNLKLEDWTVAEKPHDHES